MTCKARSAMFERLHCWSMAFPLSGREAQLRKPPSRDHGRPWSTSAVDHSLSCCFRDGTSPAILCSLITFDATDHWNATCAALGQDCITSSTTMTCHAGPAVQCSGTDSNRCGSWKLLLPGSPRGLDCFAGGQKLSCRPTPRRSSSSGFKLSFAHSAYWKSPSLMWLRISCSTIAM